MSTDQLRIKKYKDFEAVNYHQWHVCNPATKLGEKLDVPAYKFLKNPLIRKYGENWYKKLEEKAKSMFTAPKIQHPVKSN